MGVKFRFLSLSNGGVQLRIKILRRCLRAARDPPEMRIFKISTQCSKAKIWTATSLFISHSKEQVRDKNISTPTLSGFHSLNEAVLIIFFLIIQHRILCKLFVNIFYRLNFWKPKLQFSQYFAKSRNYDSGRTNIFIMNLIVISRTLTYSLESLESYL